MQIIIWRIICNPRHPSHLSQDPDSISRTFLEQFVLVKSLLISIGGLVSQTQSGHMEVRKVVEDGLLHLGTIQDLRRRFCVSWPFEYFSLWFSGLSIVQLPTRHCSLFME